MAEHRAAQQAEGENSRKAIAIRTSKPRPPAPGNRNTLTAIDPRAPAALTPIQM